jgi:hypothetical protein
MANYKSVYARAEKAAEKPFQPYTGEFVAPLTETQKAGITGVNNAADRAQPYYGAATGLTLSGAQDVGPLTQNQISYYQNPFTEAVANPTLRALQQQQGQERAIQQAQAIKSGAAFGDRSGVARAQLAGQQNLATASALAPIYERGYNNAAELAKSQQGVVASDLARRMKAGEQIAGIGTTAQESGIKGAQAQIGAGTVEQQTKQADDTAKYQQFLQERGYDFQTAQYLAGIALGFGTSSGSTTTSTQPTGFFSDARLKHDAHRIGETDDGLPIYSYKYNGDNKTQIGLMAQDVEKRKPEAVGLAPAADGRMYKTVDYDKATRSNKDYGGGVMGDYDPSSMGGAVAPGLAGEGFADGGMPGMPGVMGYVPDVKLPINKLMVADPKSLQQNKSGMASAVETGKGIAGLYDMGKTGLVGSAATSSSGEMPGLIGGGGKLKGENVFDWTKKQFAADGGLIVPRQGYAMGGGDDDDPTPYNPSEVMRGEDPMKDVLRASSQLSKGLQKPGGGGGGLGGGGQSGANQLSSALGLGKAAMSFGQEVPEFLAMFLAQGGRTPFAYGGLTPRQGYQTVGRVQDVPADYSPEADLPSPDAQDAGLVVDKPDYRSMVTNAAKKNNIDTEHAIRLAHGESTMTPRLGDEDSSAGLFQLHVGGVSQKYPNPGLGDEYFRQRRPDLHEKLSPKEKVAFLNAPENQEDAADFATSHIAKNGAKAWTVARNQGLFGLSGDAPRPPGLIGRSERAPSSYSGKSAGEASLGDVAGEYLPQGTPTSANFWVPALAGLGSMLASKNPTLLGAVGEGLVGGVAGYQSQQKQQIEMAKDLRAMLDQRFTAGTIPGDSKLYGENAGKPGFFDTNLRTWLTVDQMIKGKAGIAGSLGVSPALLGVPELPKSQPLTSQNPQQESQPQTGKPAQASETTVSGPTQQKPQAKVEGAAAPGDVYEMSTTQLADRIRQGGDKAYVEAGLVNALDPRPIEKRMAENQRELDNVSQLPDDRSKSRASELRSLLTSDSKTVMELYDRATNLQSEKNKKESDRKMAEHIEYMKDANKRMSGYQIGEKNIMSLANIYKDYEAGRASNLTAALKSWATSVGMGKMLPDNFDTLSNDAASKIVTKMGTDYMVDNGLLRAPKTINDTTQKMTPGPTLDPGAVFILMGSQLGELKRQNAEDRLYSDSNARDVNKFLRSFNDDKTKNLDIFVAAAMSELPVPKGITQDQLSKLSKDYHFVPQGQDPHELGKVQENRKLGLGKVLVPTKDGKTVELFYKLDRGQ